MIGFLIGDKDYLSTKKQKELAQQGFILITKPRKNMKHFPATPFNIALLRGRQRIENVFGNLKHNLLFINRYARSLSGYFTQAIAALVTYCIQKYDKSLYPIVDSLTFTIS